MTTLKRRDTDLPMGPLSDTARHNPTCMFGFTIPHSCNLNLKGKCMHFGSLQPSHVVQGETAPFFPTAQITMKRRLAVQSPQGVTATTTFSPYCMMTRTQKSSEPQLLDVPCSAACAFLAGLNPDAFSVHDFGPSYLPGFCALS